MSSAEFPLDGSLQFGAKETRLTGRDVLCLTEQFNCSNWTFFFFFLLLDTVSCALLRHRIVLCRQGPQVCLSIGEINLFVSSSVCLSAHLFVCPSVCLSLSVCLSVCLSLDARPSLPYVVE